jgi:hypothetical protein
MRLLVQQEGNAIKLLRMSAGADNAVVITVDWSKVHITGTGKMVVLKPGTAEAFIFNETACAFLKCADGRSIRETIPVLAQHYDTTRERLERDLQSLLLELKSYAVVTTRSRDESS